MVDRKFKGFGEMYVDGEKVATGEAEKLNVPRYHSTASVGDRLVDYVDDGTRSDVIASIVHMMETALQDGETLVITVLKSKGV